MLTRVLTTGVLLTVFATPALAEEVPSETSVQLYQVADLVAYNTVRESVETHISPAEWGAENSKTLQSLDRLAHLVNSMSSTEISKVETHPETLSLIVRNTPDGHGEVEQLLKLLRTANQPTIQLTCEPICSPDGKRIQSLPDDKRNRASELLMKKTLTSAEAREFKEILKEPGHEIYNRTVQLAPGRKSFWGIEGRPASVTACENAGQSSIQLRLDYVVDDITDKVPVASQVFDVENGASVVSHHTCDGATVIWLLTPTRIPPAKAANGQTNAQAKTLSKNGDLPK